MDVVRIEDFTTNVLPGSTLTPTKSIEVKWKVTKNMNYDTCYLAVRPEADLGSDTAFVAQALPHPQCGSGSAIITIPQQSLNASFPFQDLHVRVRLNTPYGIYADSSPFIINETYTAPWDRSQELANKANEIAERSAKGAEESRNIAIVSLVLAFLSSAAAVFLFFYRLGVDQTTNLAARLP